MTYAAETPRLWLEQLSEKPLPDFHEIWSSEQSLVWSRCLPNRTLDESRAWPQKCFPSLNPKIERYAILLRPQIINENVPPTMIGVIGTIDEGDEMVYMLHCDYWNKGYMSEALATLAGREGVFWKLPNRANVEILVAQIDPENVGSAKIIQKIGGRQGERMVKAYGLGKEKDDDGNVPEERKRDLVCWYVDRP